MGVEKRDVDNNHKSSAPQQPSPNKYQQQQGYPTSHDPHFRNTTDYSNHSSAQNMHYNNPRHQNRTASNMAMNNGNPYGASNAQQQMRGSNAYNNPSALGMYDANTMPPSQQQPQPRGGSYNNY